MILLQRLMRRLFGWEYVEIRNGLGSMDIRRVHYLPNGTRYLKGLTSIPVVLLPGGEVELHDLMCNGDARSWKPLEHITDETVPEEKK